MSRLILNGIASLLLTGAALVTSQLAQAAPQAPLPSMRKDLQNHELKDSDREVFQSEVSLKAGGFFPRNSHPGEEFIYVLKGTWVYELDGKPPVTVKAGGALFIPYGAVHSARNISDETGIELATHIIEKGKPLLTLADGESK